MQDTAMIVEMENRKKLIYQSKNRDRFTSASERIKKSGFLRITLKLFLELSC